MALSDRRVIDGISIRDTIFENNAVCLDAQSLGVFVVGWESRSLNILKNAQVRGKNAVLIRFDGDGIEEDVQKEFESAAHQKFDNVQVRILCNAKETAKLKGQLESLVSELKLADLSQVAIDYSSMPRVVLQTLFRLFVTEGVSPRVNWIYSSGAYDDTSVVGDGFQQGVEGGLFSVHGGYGKPTSEQRIGIVSLGADQDLVSTFLRHENYEDKFFIYSPSRTSKQLEEKIKYQIFWLQSQHGISKDQMFHCDEHDVVSSLGVLSEILLRYSDYPNASFDIFCAGPKTHSIAASTLLTKFKNVRLLGRVPKAYSRMDIKPTGMCTVTEVTDYTNVLVGRMLDLV